MTFSLKNTIVFITFISVWQSLPFQVNNLFAQQSDSSASRQEITKNALYGEFAAYLFNGCISLNYERSITEELWLRVGYGSGGYRSVDGDSHGDGKGGMLMALYLLGGSSKFEVGLGASFIYGIINNTAQEDWWLIPAASLGYRYQPTDGGIMFRVGLTYDYYGGVPCQISLGCAF